MLTFKEFLCEWSFTSKGIGKHMADLGYKKLGNGVDQTAFIKPGEDSIIKIFGTAERKSERSDFTDGQKMFKWWEAYCKKHKSNPFLPKFEDWEAFEYKGGKYLQIKMEKLGKIPNDVGSALEGSLVYWAERKSKKAKIEGIKKVKDFSDNERSHITSGSEKKTRDAGVAQLMMLLGEEHFDLLYKTICDLTRIAGTNGWTFDLHAGNFMYRNDGTPVIVDPFVV